MGITVFIDNRQRDLPLCIDPLIPLIHAVLKGENVRAEAVALYLVSAEESGAIHSEHFDDPAPTDCMAFPLDGPPGDLGELVVCPKVAMDYVKEEGGDPHEEVALYAVHALLHLLGYDDKTAQSEPQMRAAEARYREAIVSCASQLKGVL